MLVKPSVVDGEVVVDTINEVEVVSQLEQYLTGENRRIPCKRPIKKLDNL